MRNKERLDKFSTSTKLVRVEGERTVTREVRVYNFMGLLEICRYSQQDTANAVIDTLWAIAEEIRRTGSYNAKPVVQDASDYQWQQLNLERAKRTRVPADGREQGSDSARGVQDTDRA